MPRTLGDIWATVSRSTPLQLAEACAKALAAIYTVALAFFLFLADKLSEDLGITTEQLTAGFVVMVGGFLLYLDKRLTQILRTAGMAPHHVNMREAFDEVFGRYPHVKVMRIYGSTTQLMVQWFEGCCRRDESIYVHECRVMAHYFCVNDFPDQAPHYNTIRKDSCSKWRSFEGSNIGTVTCRVSGFLPQTFLVLLDNKAAIFGLYVPRPSGPTGLFDLKSLVVLASGSEERALIDTYAAWFDSWYALASEESDEQQRTPVILPSSAGEPDLEAALRHIKQD